MSNNNTKDWNRMIIQVDSKSTGLGVVICALAYVGYKAWKRHDKLLKKFADAGDKNNSYIIEECNKRFEGHTDTINQLIDSYNDLNRKVEELQHKE